MNVHSASNKKTRKTDLHFHAVSLFKLMLDTKHKFSGAKLQRLLATHSKSVTVQQQLDMLSAGLVYQNCNRRHNPVCKIFKIWITDLIKTLSYLLSVLFWICSIFSGPPGVFGSSSICSCDKDRPTSAALAGEECSQGSAKIHTSMAE